MKDLTKLTPEEADKISVFLLLMKTTLQEMATKYDSISKSKFATQEEKETFRSNAAWCRGLYRLLYEEEPK